MQTSNHEIEKLAFTKRWGNNEQFKELFDGHFFTPEIVLGTAPCLSMNGTANQAGVLELNCREWKADGFYRGAVADAIVTATSGHITLDDLKDV